MKILIEVPDDHAALMKGIAGYHEKTLEEWVVGVVYHVLRADLEGASTDMDDCKMPKQPPHLAAVNRFGGAS